MAINFSKFGRPGHPPLISPRQIFSSLPARWAGFGYLRDVQGKVLDAWMPRRDERDLLIKMNTGTGKPRSAASSCRARSTRTAGRRFT